VVQYNIIWASSELLIVFNLIFEGCTMDLRAYIRQIPDFPKEGVLFRDISPLIQNGPAFRRAIGLFTEFAAERDVDVVIGPESRGFIFGAPLACHLGVGFAPVRKPGRLPAKTSRMEYELEYGTDSLEIHTDAVKPGQKVLVVDDLLATGGTSLATARLVEGLGAE
ncbi:MAG TPA: adenine phosphoribosyltransferase, partial [Bacillota bacterium]|nr:adenine phosphoribosyltransferase [Bacillota bacterium]